MNLVMGVCVYCALYLGEAAGPLLPPPPSEPNLVEHTDQELVHVVVNTFVILLTPPARRD